MQNEIIAEMLAREMCRMNGGDPDAMIADDMTAHWLYLDAATSHILATRALAALQSGQSKPERDECSHQWCGSKCGEPSDPEHVRQLQ